MPMTDKKRKTDAAWKKANKTRIGCTVYKADADAFAAYAAAQGRSVNDLLRGYVAQCLGRPLERRDKTVAAEKAQDEE